MSDELKFSQLRYSLKKYEGVQFYLVSDYEHKNDFESVFEDENYTVEGVRYEDGKILYKSDADDIFNNVRILETAEYDCKIFTSCDYKIYPMPELKAVLKDENKKHYSFRVINYLGKSCIKIISNDMTYHDANKDNVIAEIKFEVVPTKIDYEEDYIKLTEDIAQKCSELLIDFASPTQLTFNQDFSKEYKTPLEKFIFIKKFCASNSIRYIFSAIKNNPDRLLQNEDEFKPLGISPISTKFFTHPFTNSKNWYDQDGNFFPEFALSTRKFDSYDTAANRFVKFAINTFISVCDEVIDCVKDVNLTYHVEASVLKQNLENILCDSFFDDIGNLVSMPVNNQVLQKREGYYQIFSAFNMLDFAMQLEWHGHKNVFEGQARNIALLYEYWLVFQMIDILKNLGGKFYTNTENSNSMFCASKENKLLISIREGKESVLSFTLPDYKLKINFYYNRTFTSKDFHNTKYEGSYSRNFRPDYTLAIFPSKYENENCAINDGAVSFVHFDAKYRIENITSLFGSEYENIFSNEKTDEVIHTYKRGDLLKMHTYNDAIRRTIGSYVLYPGTDNNSKKVFNVYDEILPGIGAFAIRPSNKNDGCKSISNFIKDILDFKSKIASRQARKEYFENMVIRSPSMNGTVHNAEYNDFYMVGFIRDDYYKFLCSEGIIPPNDCDTSFSSSKEFYFYYYAIKNDNVFIQHKDISRSKYFCAYTDFSYDITKVRLHNWKAEIITTELVSTNILTEKLKAKGFVANKNHSADYYFLATLKNATYQDNSSVQLQNDVSNIAASIHSPRVIKL